MFSETGFGGYSNCYSPTSLRISDYYSDFYSNLPVASISRLDADPRYRGCSCSVSKI
jgi:hypothetical protein